MNDDHSSMRGSAARCRLWLPVLLIALIPGLVTAGGEARSSAAGRLEPDRQPSARSGFPASTKLAASSAGSDAAAARPTAQADGTTDPADSSPRAAQAEAREAPPSASGKGAVEMPDGAPLPPRRPAAPEATAAQAEVPLPPPRPAAAELVSDGIEAPPPETAAPALPGAPQDEGCLKSLRDLGVEHTARAPITEGSCGTPRPLLVSRLPGGVAVTPPATMTCAMAEALARWTKDSVAPAAERHLSARLEALQIGTSYQCRSQNHVAGAKLSEHGLANAVDLHGFAIAGRSIAVRDNPSGSSEAAFIGAVRQGACAHFTTVLGPGSDASHDDHLHLDMRARRNDYRLCQ